MNVALMLFIVSCVWTCEKIVVLEKELLCCDGEVCVDEGGPCVRDWMGVCGGWRRDVEEGDVGYDLSMNIGFVLVPFCVLFLFWKLVFRRLFN